MLRFCLLLTLLSPLLRAQELPPVVTFTPDEYRAGSQNWSIAQDESGFIYVANNEGLLEYDGSVWRHYPSPNESILRSVHAGNGRIYTGSYMDFGYWDRGADGRLSYLSLSDSVAGQLLPDEQFWDILGFRDIVLFQSLQQFFLYRPATGAVTQLRPPGGVTKTFLLGDELYFTDPDGGLHTIEEGQIRTLLPPDPGGRNLVHLWAEGDRQFVLTATRGVYELRGDELLPTDRLPFLADLRVYSAISLRGGGQAFGTVSSGVFVTGPGGRLRYRLDRINGLTNNTVLSLFQDGDRNVWVGSDNGLNCLNLASPLRKYTDRSGRLGTVYAAARHAGRLYVGTNQGLFVREGRQFRLLPDTRGQVWSLFAYRGTLFCGHDAGTFLVSEQGVEKLGGQEGSWTFVPVPDRPDLLLVGGYGGLSVLERGADGDWQFRNTVRGFSLSARYLALVPGPRAFVSHEYRGVYGLELDEGYRRVVDSTYFERPEKGQRSGLVRYRDSVYYYSRRGLYVFRDAAGTFDRLPKPSGRLAGKHYLSGRITPTEDRLWLLTSEGPAYLDPAVMDRTLEVTALPIRTDLIGAPLGYENFTPLGRDSLLIGTADGYLLLDYTEPYPDEPELYLTAVRAGSGTGTLLHLAGGPAIDYQSNDLSFQLAVPDYSAYFHPRFRYRLAGQRAQWSEWRNDGLVTVTDLPYGSYVFEAQAMLAGTPAEEILRFAFTIRRPWYASYPVLLLYIITSAGFIYALHRAYTRYYARKERGWREEQARRAAARDRLAELELTRLNNERLREDIEAKNREAALSTMNLVKKNELLQRIRQDLLEGSSVEKNVRRVIDTIDRNLDEAETWSLFRDAFENADRDFFKKIKLRHPELTPNDLKVCAYLRLNLSTKEIASLLNISPRSVEVKRYRLRKRMGLEREANLVDHILSI
jgi:DNA-binding CsgD family transcriptional regulator